MKSQIDKFPIYVFVDLDNTVIDTAIRKQRLLEEKYEMKNVDVSLVRGDYWLESFLGYDSKVAASFFAFLDSEECIKQIDAPIFEGAAETLQAIRNRGYQLRFLSARPEQLKEITISELKAKEIECNPDELLMPNVRPQSDEEVKQFKKATLIQFFAFGSIAAVVGDRPSDILAAQELRIPALLLNSTMSKSEISYILKYETVGIFELPDWHTINSKLIEIEQGGQYMQDMRQMFTNQYASWLKDLDGKLQTVSIIAGAVIAFCGFQVNSITTKGFEFYLLVSSLFFATFALLYAIRGLTSRHTSGPEASISIGTKAKQWIAILIGGPISWKALPNDPIDVSTKLRKSSPTDQLTAHTKFFFGHYKTNNPEMLQNLRLLELRSANYSKVYPERIASHLLSLSIFILLIKFLWQMIFG